MPQLIVFGVVEIEVVEAVSFEERIPSSTPEMVKEKFEPMFAVIEV